jgi:acyl-CoA synthetase (AMP-forming)/AMP-acid ligase II/acyl carrier protein
MSDFPFPANLVSLVDLLQFRAVQQAEQTAYTFLLDGEQTAVSLTYGELDRRARAIATDLSSHAPGTRALLVYPAGLDYITALFGCLYAQLIAVPAYPPKRNHSLTRLESIVQDAQPQIALTTHELWQQMRSRLHQFNVLDELNWIATDTATDSAIDSAIDSVQANKSLTDRLSRQVSQAENNISQAEDIAILQYTSGSTSAPKGVMLSHQNLLHNLAAIQQRFGHDAQSRGVIWLPPYHDMGLIGGILQPLYVGFPVVLMSPQMFVQQPIRWLRAIAQHKATTSGAPNFAYELCIQKIKLEQLANLDLSSWQVAFNGAEPLRPETLENFTKKFAPYGFQRDAFYPCYGLAEATLFVSGRPASTAMRTLSINRTALTGNQVVLEPNKGAADVIVSCGQSLADQVVAIADPETQQPCSEHEVGEIWIAGASIAQGYWNRPQETQDMFQAQIMGGDRSDRSDRSDQRTYLRTGDLGFLHQGELFITGRLKDLIVIRGRNHYPQDIEQTVQLSHPDLRSGVAFTVLIEGEEQLAIAQELDRQVVHRLSAEQATEIMQLIRRAIATEHELQAAVILLVKQLSLPKTSSGKLQRQATRTAFLQDQLEVLHRSIVSFQDQVEPAQTVTVTRTHPSASVADWLTEELARYLKVSSDEIDVSQPFAYYGLDSSVALSMTGELAEWLGREELDPTLFWEYPSIEALSNYLEGQNI